MLPLFYNQLQKMLNTIRFSLLIILVLSFSSFCFSQDGSSDDFEEAVKLYSDGKYLDALTLFEKVIEDYSENSKTTASIIFKGKSLLALNRIIDAKNTTIDFLNEYPSSRYVYEARFLLSKIYLEIKDYPEAFKQLLIVIQNSDSDLYSANASESGENLALQYLSISDVRTIYNSHKLERIKSYLLLILAKLQINNNLYDDAAESLNELIRNYSDSEYKYEAELLLPKISNRKADSKRSETILCIMLPLSGLSSNDAQTVSKEILEGIKFALSEFNKDREDKIGLMIKDTENNHNTIVNIKNEIINNPSVKLIIGPVFSSEASIVLDEFSLTDIPIISPTATDNDLTLLNENFFQANPNFVIRAKAMAQHIFYVENKRRMAVLNSIEGYSPLLAAEFSREFEKLGGEIVVKYTYKSANLSKSLIKIDSTELVPAEGIYLPLSNKIDAPLLLSQLVQNNVNLPLYGNQDWFLASGFETSPELSNKMIFTSDYYINYSNSTYKQFSEDFIRKTKLDANRSVLYGYDVAKYVLTVLRNINRDRKSIKSKMESEILVSGFHNNILFNENRVNCFINIVRYRDGFFELVDKFKVGN